jgi:hypothetical protein
MKEEIKERRDRRTDRREQENRRRIVKNSD